LQGFWYHFLVGAKARNGVKDSTGRNIGRAALGDFTPARQQLNSASSHKKTIQIAQ
jgi:hypothetical protein